LSSKRGRVYEHARTDVEAKRRCLQLLKERFNSGVSYKGRVPKWDTVIKQKTMELARYVTGKSKILDLSEPKSELERTDSFELRRRILSLSISEARRLGIGKSTLHYLRKYAGNERLLTIYEKVRSKLMPESHPSRTHLARATNR
jgi:CRISPR-associated protein Cas1